jgi:segregation and condensation protein A
MAYKIKLPVFEGPFDLLLYLIKKNEVDIYEIPIAEITHQYLEYLEMMQMLDLDIAGEFIEMVAILMLIKVRMLFPSPLVDDDIDVEDPRARLVAQLLEYRRFKEASASFSELESENKKRFSRTMADLLTEDQSDENGILKDFSLFDLLTAFKTALHNMPKVTVHQVSIIKITLEDQVKFIFNQIGKRTYILFREICKPLKEKIELIVTFMAILDLIRLKFLSAKQPSIFGELRLVALKPLRMEDYLEERDKELIAEKETVNSPLQDKKD